MAEREDPADSLQAAVVDLLATGPMLVTDLLGPLDRLGRLDYLRAEGVPDEDLSDAVIEDALSDDSIWVTTDDIVALTQPLLDGLVLTHRLTAEDCLLGEVPITPDLVILDWDADDTDLSLAGGGRLVHQLSQDFVPGSDGSAFAGPDGWLNGFVAGDLVVFTRGGGAVRVERVTEPAEDALEVGLLRDAAEKRIPPGSCEEAVPILLDALVADPGAFRRPVRPVDELLAAAGFERRGFSFGRIGEPWKSFGEQFDERQGMTLTRTWGFSACCHEAFSLITAAFASFVTDPADVDGPALAGALRHGTVAMAFAESALGSSAEGDEALRRFAAAVLDGAPLKRSSAALLLLALESERRGDAVAAEDALRAALRADPEYGSAAVELVDYEIDRGDISRALTGLRHPEIGPDRLTIGLLEKLRSELGARQGSAGRNDRCPCGSGRKFKVCCQRNPTLPLSDRLGLLLTKLDRFGQRPHRSHVLLDVARWACDPDEPDPVAARDAMADDPVIADFATFEGGVAVEPRRRPVMPREERLALTLPVITGGWAWSSPMAGFKASGSAPSRRSSSGPSRWRRSGSTSPSATSSGDSGWLTSRPVSSSGPGARACSLLRLHRL